MFNRHDHSLRVSQRDAKTSADERLLREAEEIAASISYSRNEGRDYPASTAVYTTGDFPLLKYCLNKTPKEFFDKPQVFSESYLNRQSSFLVAVARAKRIQEVTDEHIFLLLSCIMDDDVNLLKNLLQKFGVNAFQKEDRAQLYYTAIRCERDNSLSCLLQSSIIPDPFAFALAFQYRVSDSNIDALWNCLQEQGKLEALEYLVAFCFPKRPQVPQRVTDFYERHARELSSNASYRELKEVKPLGLEQKAKKSLVESKFEEKTAEIVASELMENVRQREFSLAYFKIKNILQRNEWYMPAGEGDFNEVLGSVLLLPDSPVKRSLVSLMFYCNRKDGINFISFFERKTPALLKILYRYIQYTSTEDSLLTPVHRWLWQFYKMNLPLDVTEFKKIYAVLNCTSEKTLENNLQLFSGNLTSDEYKILYEHCKIIPDRFEVILKRFHIPVQRISYEEKDRLIPQLIPDLETIVLSYLSGEQNQEIYYLFPASCVSKEIKAKNKLLNEAALQEIKNLQADLRTFKTSYKFDFFAQYFKPGFQFGFDEFLSLFVFVAMLTLIISFVKCVSYGSEVVAYFAALKDIQSQSLWEHCKFYGCQPWLRAEIATEASGFEGCIKFCADANAMLDSHPTSGWFFIHLAITSCLFLCVALPVIRQLPATIKNFSDPSFSSISSMSHELSSRLRRLATIRHNPALREGNIPSHSLWSASKKQTVSGLLTILESEERLVKQSLEIQEPEEASHVIEFK